MSINTLNLFNYAFHDIIKLTYTPTVNIRAGKGVWNIEIGVEVGNVKLSKLEINTIWKVTQWF